MGSIIWAPVREPINRTLVAEHPAMVLSPQTEIDAGSDLRVAVCTTDQVYPLPSGWFDMPSQPGGHPVTGLKEAGVVKATWLDDVPQSSVRKVTGRAPSEVFKQVRNWLRCKKLEGNLP